MRASLTALTSWRSFGAVSVSDPGPHRTALPFESSISTSPSTITIHARSCTWCSWSSSPAGRLIAIVRPSSSEWRTFG